MPDGQAELPTAGHNNPPPSHFREDVVEAHAAKAAQFLDAAAEWQRNGAIEDEETAGKLVDFMAGVKGVATQVEADRKADKKPHDDAGKAVQGAYVPILNKLKKAVDDVDRKLMAPWKAELQRRRAAEARRLQKEAEEARKLAEERAAQAAARKDISGEVDAEAAQKEADEKRKAAERAAAAPVQVKSASGAARTVGTRTTWEAEITDLRLAFMSFADHPDLTALLIRLAEAKARAKDFDPRKDKIAGFNLIERTK